MIEPSLQINENEFKPLSQLSKGETVTLQLNLWRKLDMIRTTNSHNVARQLETFLAMIEDRLNQFESGVLVDTPKETTKRSISILDDDF